VSGNQWLFAYLSGVDCALVHGMSGLSTFDRFGFDALSTDGVGRSPYGPLRGRAHGALARKPDESATFA
jgi:hypothetical protein